MPDVIWFLVEGGIIAAILIFYLTRFGQKLDKREEARIEESVVTISMLKAIGHLSEANAIALQCGKCNGEMDRAMTYYTKANDDLTNYLVRQSAERLHVR